MAAEVIDHNAIQGCDESRVVKANAKILADTEVPIDDMSMVYADCALIDRGLFVEVSVEDGTSPGGADSPTVENAVTLLQKQVDKLGNS